MGENGEAQEFTVPIYGPAPEGAPDPKALELLLDMTLWGLKFHEYTGAPLPAGFEKMTSDLINRVAAARRSAGTLKAIPPEMIRYLNTDGLGQYFLGLRQLMILTNSALLVLHREISAVSATIEVLHTKGTIGGCPIPGLPAAMFADLKRAMNDLDCYREALTRAGRVHSGLCLGCGGDLKNVPGARQYCAKPKCKKMAGTNRQARRRRLQAESEGKTTRRTWTIQGAPQSTPTGEA